MWMVESLALLFVIGFTPAMHWKDWFAFQLSEDRSVQISVAGNPGVVELYDADGVFIASGNTTDLLNRNKLVSGDYLVRVHGGATPHITLDYSLAIQTGAPVEAVISVQFSAANPGNDIAARVDVLSVTTTNLVLASEQPSEQGAQDAAGCVGSASANGMALVLLSLLIAAGALRVQRRKAAHEQI